MNIHQGIKKTTRAGREHESTEHLGHGNSRTQDHPQGPNSDNNSSQDRRPVPGDINSMAQQGTSCMWRSWH